MVWDHLNIDDAHTAYAILGTFAAIFMLVSLLVKEKAYIGEASVATIIGLIVGPHVLGWFTPTTWGNTDYLTLEISRIVLCLQIFAVAVELPKKYMLKHWFSVFMLLVPVMTSGWLIVGLFMWIIIPQVNFAEALVLSACITATDPVLAAAVVGKGKFAKRVPGHLRNLLSAESGCNDGMAFPFIYLGINLVIHHGNAKEIVKEWICVTILYECIFGCILGAIIGYVGRHAIKRAEKWQLIDRESFLAFYIALAFACAGFGSMLGADDLLVSFAAGAAFAWDGWFAKKTEEAHVSTVIDLILNLAYFVYFGSIIPWDQFNSASLPLPIGRLIALSFVIIFLRRIPAVMALKPFIPDIKTWREALFCGHFGPIGVGAVFAAILARAELEGAAHPSEATPTDTLPSEDSEYGHLIAIIWPVTTFLVVTSIIVHGSSVAVITLGRHLNTMAISMSFTTTNGNEKSSSWMTRLPELKANGRSFSLHRVDTQAPTLVGDRAGELSQSATIETSGVPVRPAGGMERRKNRKERKKRRGLKKVVSHHDDTVEDYDRERIQREKEAKAATFALGSKKPVKDTDLPDHNEEGYPRVGITPAATFNSPVLFPASANQHTHSDEEEDKEPSTSSTHENDYERSRKPTNAYREGSTLIVEDQHGEILDQARLVDEDNSEAAQLALHKSRSNSSSISSVISPSRLNGITGEKNKFVAYRTGQQLIIENEDGEVVRRYRINQHAKPKASAKVKADDGSEAGHRSRSSTMLSDMLAVVGLKKSNSGSGSVLPTTMPNKSTFGADDTIPEGEDDDEDEDDEDFEDEEEDEVGDDSEEETAVERQRRLAALGQLETNARDDDDEEDTVVTPSTRSAKPSGGLMIPSAITEEKN